MRINDLYIQSTEISRQLGLSHDQKEKFEKFLDSLDEEKHSFILDKLDARIS